jgi:hypothetical protein
MTESEPLARDPDAGREHERRVREAEQAHGGSMAPGLVDETGHPVAEPPPSPPGPDEER